MTGLTFGLMAGRRGGQAGLVSRSHHSVFCAVLAVWVVHSLKHRVVPAAVLVLGIAGLVHGERRTRGWLLHRTDYERSVSASRSVPADCTDTTARRSWAALNSVFRLGSIGSRTIPGWGFIAGSGADLVVVEEIYEGWFRKHEASEPDVYRHVRRTLAGARKVFDNGQYRVFR